MTNRTNISEKIGDEARLGTWIPRVPWHQCVFFGNTMFIIWLVVLTILKICKSVGMTIPNTWKIKNVPNHQPDNVHHQITHQNISWHIMTPLTHQDTSWQIRRHHDIWHTTPRWVYSCRPHLCMFMCFAGCNFLSLGWSGCIPATGARYQRNRCQQEVCRTNSWSHRCHGKGVPPYRGAWPLWCG